MFCFPVVTRVCLIHRGVIGGQNEGVVCKILFLGIFAKEDKSFKGLGSRDCPPKGSPVFHCHPYLKSHCDLGAF